MLRLYRHIFDGFEHIPIEHISYDEVNMLQEVFRNIYIVRRWNILVGDLQTYLNARYPGPQMGDRWAQYMDTIWTRTRSSVARLWIIVMRVRGLAEGLPVVDPDEERHGTSEESGESEESEESDTRYREKRDYSHTTLDPFQNLTGADVRPTPDQERMLKSWAYPLNYSTFSHNMSYNDGTAYAIPFGPNNISQIFNRTQ